MSLSTRCHTCHKIVTEMSRDCHAMSPVVTDVSRHVTKMSRQSHIFVTSCHKVSQRPSHQSHRVTECQNNGYAADASIDEARGAAAAPRVGLLFCRLIPQARCPRAPRPSKPQHRRRWPLSAPTEPQSHNSDRDVLCLPAQTS